jgi:hypothetical protein
VQGVNENQVDNLRHNQIEPALRDNDWRGAAIAAANGLDVSPSSTGRYLLLTALGVIVLAVVILLVVMRRRARRRRADALAAAR